MISVGMVLGAAVFYWFGLYKWAFWILIYAIANGCFGALYAVVNRNWYSGKMFSAGGAPNYPQLFITKGIMLALLIPIAWHVGILAGYVGINWQDFWLSSLIGTERIGGVGAAIAVAVFAIVLVMEAVAGTLPNLRELVLYFLPALAGYAGYAALPLYVIPLIGAASGVWNLAYFGLKPLRIASGGPFTYLIGVSILNTILAAAFYAAGSGLMRLLA